ncbi:MAG: zinc ribbon domain-containing protein [Lachnospiraceae bacterium]|nr:zinc ribbon domain-containing protein [Lachnospiraceae bacterium]
MFCDKCGSQLVDGEAYCLECGAPIYISQQKNVQPTYTYSQIYPSQMAVSGVQNTNLNYYNNPESKKKYSGLNRKKVIILSSLILVIIVVTLIILCLPGNYLSPQRKIIDEYFEAINDKNMEEIYEIEYDDKALRFRNDYDTDKLFFFTNNNYMGFNRGLYEVDYLRTTDVVYNTYPNIKNENSEERVTRKTLNMLYADYKLVDITPLEDFDLTMQGYTGLKEVTIDDVEELANKIDFKTGDKSNIKVDKVYIAQVKIEWYYDDLKYGLDKKWWNDEEFCTLIERYDGYKSYKAALDSFGKFANTDKDKVYILILYKAEGEWHIAKADRLGTLQTSYEKGKATIMQ